MGKQALYKAYLEREGYHPTIDADGDVVFKYEGGTYYIENNQNDDQYFWLVFPNFWRIETPEDLARALLAANHATRVSKAAKVCVRKDNTDTAASIELFFERPEQFIPVFRRAMSALKNGVNTFAEQMEK